MAGKGCPALKRRQVFGCFSYSVCKFEQAASCPYSRRLSWSITCCKHAWSRNKHCEVLCLSHSLAVCYSIAEGSLTSALAARHRSLVAIWSGARERAKCSLQHGVNLQLQKNFPVWSSGGAGSIKGSKCRALLVNGADFSPAHFFPIP